MSVPMYRTVQQPRSIITFVPSAVSMTHEIAVTRQPGTSQPLTELDFHYVERMMISPGATVRVFNGPNLESCFDVRMIPVLPIIMEEPVLPPPPMAPDVDPEASP